MEPKQLRVSLLQMGIAEGRVEDNFRNAQRLVRKAMSDPAKPDLIVLPEMWNTGYALERIGELADYQGRRTRMAIGALCREYGVMAAAGSVAERSDKGVCNTSYAIGRDGRAMGDYSKLHLFGLMNEDAALAAGGALQPVDFQGLKAGILICYDIRFPEAARSLALLGARLLIVPAQWPRPRLHHWRTLLMARAIENQLFVIGCNRVGEGDSHSFFGHSMIIDPWGQVLAEAGEEEEIVSASLNLEQVEEVRAAMPVFKDRRPALYHQG